jgi:hypothetical protein
VAAAGLVGGLGGLAVALELRSLIATTATRPSASRLFWGTVLLGVSGLLAGLAVEAVRQLQQNSPDPAYRQRRR